MGHSRVRIKVRRRKVAALAAYSRQFTVKNTKKGISEVINHKRYGTEIPKDKLITSPYTGIQYVMTNPHPIHGEKYGITVTGYDWVPIEEYKTNSGLLWEHKKYPQPKRLIKCKKKMKQKGTAIIPARNDFFAFMKFSKKTRNKVHLMWTPEKMNKVQYMEKLVEHKLVKWERKNPYPVYSPDIFYSQEEFNKDVEKWKQERETMKERFRDFVVSIYDKLHLTGRFVVAENNYTEEPVAEIKDVDGEGHHVNDLPKTSKLIKKAQKITNEVKSKRQNLVATNLKDHKQKKGRIILPQAAQERCPLARVYWSIEKTYKTGRSIQGGSKPPPPLTKQQKHDNKGHGRMGIRHRSLPKLLPLLL